MNANLRRVPLAEPFAQLTRDHQLDALDIARRVAPQAYGTQSVIDALAEDSSAPFLAAIFDKQVSDEELGQRLRQLQIRYMGEVARHRRDDLEQYL